MLAELPIGLVNRLEQLVERGCFLDRPRPVERRPEQAEIALGEQSNGNDSLASRVARNLH